MFLVVCSRQYNYFETPITQSRALAFANSMSARVDSVPANAIDLGLPSGTLWADHNIGAKFPTDCGWYLAWGETAPHPDAVYRTKNYKHYYKSISVGHGKSRKTYTIFSKYQQQYKDIKLYKNPDRIPRLDLIDDVARTQWRGRWRVPTRKQLRELYSECNWKIYVTDDGLRYCKVIGSNGNYIEIPFAGYIRNDAMVEYNSKCYLWGANVSGATGALNLQCSPKSYTIKSDLYRVWGVPVRPVYIHRRTPKI